MILDRERRLPLQGGFGGPTYISFKITASSKPPSSYMPRGTHSVEKLPFIEFQAFLQKRVPI